MDAEAEKQAPKVEQDHSKEGAAGARAAEGARAGLAAQAMDEYKIGDKVVKLPGGFQRNEPPEERKVFPAPDLTKHLVPKGSPDASTGQSPRSTGDAVKYKIGEVVGDALGWIVRKKAAMADEYTKDKPWEE